MVGGGNRFFSTSEVSEEAKIVGEIGGRGTWWISESRGRRLGGPGEDGT